MDQSRQINPVRSTAISYPGFFRFRNPDRVISGVQVGQRRTSDLVYQVGNHIRDTLSMLTNGAGCSVVRAVIFRRFDDARMDRLNALLGCQVGGGVRYSLLIRGRCAG